MPAPRLTSAAEDHDERWLQTQAELIERALQAELGSRLPSARISEAVARATERFRHAPVRQFLPMLIGRAARQELLAAIQHPHRAA